MILKSVPHAALVVTQNKKDTTLKQKGLFQKK